MVERRAKTEPLANHVASVWNQTGAARALEINDAWIENQDEQNPALAVPVAPPGDQRCSDRKLRRAGARWRIT